MRLSSFHSLPLSLLLLLDTQSTWVWAKQPVCRLAQHQAVFNAGAGGGGTTTTSSSSPAATSSTIQKFDYTKDIIRGVNLGGWFVLEPWITPSIFEGTGNNKIVDEYTMGQMMDRTEMQGILNAHWQEWITEDDFKEMSDAGLNHVRIPLGYWSVPLTSNDTKTSTSVDPYLPGAWPYFLKALNMAHAHNLHTIVDIHGAPGSQNGFDNSGQRTNNPTWASANSDDNVQRTLDTIQFVVENAGGLIDVMELLNEPAGFNGNVWSNAIRQFWKDGYGVVRKAVGNGMQVMIGDAFLGVNNWQDFLTPPDARGVLMDYHEYQIFSNLELSRSFSEHISFSCSNLTSLQSFNSQNIRTVIGEWSNAPTDCAKWLNGYGVGARWEGKWYQDNQVHGSCDNMTGPYVNYSQEYRDFLRQYWEAQVTLGERIAGWVYWTWKTEEADEWSYQKGLEGGWIPRNPDDRKYPNVCS
ncbi:glycoside hydrolase family 5 protein [Flagelloscypha sp. PMI_526]|nr:glycoside hydrolase family 5 protein [Flagelloscypha sp. PMI_526]